MIQRMQPEQCCVRVCAEEFAMFCRRILRCKLHQGSRKCQRTRILSPILKKKLEHLVSVRGDLAKAKGALCSLTDHAAMFGGSRLLEEAVFTLAIVADVRCFATGRRKGLSQEVFAGQPKLLEAHNNFKSIRDQHIAHAVGVLEDLHLFVAAENPSSPAQGVGALGV